MRRISFQMLLLYILLGAVVGALIGDVVGWFLPSGVVKDFFVRGITLGFDPVHLDLKVLSMVFGFKYTLNISGLIGIFVAVYILKWYK